MSDKVQWPYEQALDVAIELCKALGDSCTNLVVAGSLRRGKATVGDIELLAIPKAQAHIFFTDTLDEDIKGLIADGVLDFRRNIKDSVTYGLQNKLLVHVPSGIPVDIFSTEARYWGMSLLVRTGSKDFNIAVMQRFQDMGMQGHAYKGYTDRYGEEHDCREEEDVFRALGWHFIPPEKREAGQFKLYTLPR